jgi:hypothetical protein
MRKAHRILWIWSMILVCIAGAGVARGQGSGTANSEFGPIVRAYLAYLKNEQEVVDDRASRHEIKRAYYLRNSNRIRALRQAAVRIARETSNDYLPELEAAAAEELRNLFETPPKPAILRQGEVYSNTFRYLGSVRSGDTFYIFARLDPYEQAEMIEKAKPNQSVESSAVAPTPQRDEETSRPRRVGSP